MPKKKTPVPVEEPIDLAPEVPMDSQIEPVDAEGHPEPEPEGASLLSQDQGLAPDSALEPDGIGTDDLPPPSAETGEDLENSLSMEASDPAQMNENNDPIGDAPLDPQYEDLLQELSNKPPLEQDGADQETVETVSTDAVESAEPPETDGISKADGSGEDDRTEAPPEQQPSREDYVLTIDAHDRIPMEDEQKEIAWHEIRTSHITGRILTGTLDGVEQTKSGRTIVVVDYKGYRVAIPIREMMLHTGPTPYGAAYYSLMDRMNRTLATMMNAEIDFIVRGVDMKERSVVASRRAAMLRKRQTFYMDTNEAGQPMIYEGRVVQARVVGVAEKVLRVEVFGVECAIFARDLSATWMGDARDRYSVGDRVLVRVKSIDRPDIARITITADIRSVSNISSHDNLKKLLPQSRYAGRVTDVRDGVVFIRLNNGANAIAHTCLDRRMPGKKDDVSFAVTRLDEERGVAIGIITRIIKQNL